MVVECYVVHGETITRKKVQLIPGSDIVASDGGHASIGVCFEDIRDAEEYARKLREITNLKNEAIAFSCNHSLWAKKEGAV